MPNKWTATTAPEASSRTDDIWFLDEDTGWAVNSDGKILSTSDGGQTWTLQHRAPNNAYLRCVTFGTRRNGWVGALTGKDRILSTADAGATWVPVGGLPPRPNAICGLYAVNASVVYASGTNYPDRPAAVLKTVDGGSTWSLIDMAAHANLLVDIYFATPDRGWVVGGFGGTTRNKVKPVVLYTEDGGQSWTNQLAGQEAAFPFGEWGWKIQFLSDRVGFVSLENFSAGAVLRTEDGGRTWSRLPVNDPQRNANLEGIGFLDKDHGWVGGWGDRDFKGGYTSATVNGGKTWTDANEVGKHINRFRFFGSPVRTGYASGKTIYKYADVEAGAAMAFFKAPVQAVPKLVVNEHEEVAVDALTILIDVPVGARRLTVDVWDRFGAHLGTIVEKANPAAGTLSAVWRFVDAKGQSLPSGHYIYRVCADDQAESRIVLRTSPGALRPQRGFAGPSAMKRLHALMAAEPVKRDQKPPLPSVEQEREAFFRIANIEDFPEFRPTAKALAHTYLENADYDEDPLYAKFTYTAEAFSARLKEIYEQYLPDMYGQHAYDRDVIRWSNGKYYRVGRASDAVVRDRALQMAPFNLMDGVWLQSIMQARPADPVQSRLFAIWADEVGNGQTRENHSNVYQDLLRSLGLYLPPVTSREFLDLDIAPGAWRSPVFQLCVGLFPQEFFPELIGMTLFLEWEATPTMMPIVRMLRGRGINPQFYALHVAIDNISKGHGALAKEAVQIYLEEKREEGGERAVQASWQRIWNGYVTWATAGFNGAGLAERRLLIDRKTINLGIPTEPDCFPKWNTHYSDRMVAMIQRKAAAASQVHGRAMVEGALLNDLFSRPEELMAKLVSSGMVDLKRPRDSKLLELMSFDGPMYRVFSDDDRDIILDWIESQSHAPTPCIDPIEPDPSAEPLPNRMARLITTFAAIGRRAHDGLTLPDGLGNPQPLVNFLADPVEMMKALIRSGFVIPGEPGRSMFLTRILENGGPMEGVFDAQDVDTVRQWIQTGAELPKAGALGMMAVAASAASAPMTLGERRPFIGQGAVH